MFLFFVEFQPKNINQTLPLIVHVLHALLSDRLANPQILSGLRSRLLGGHKSGVMNAGVESLLLKEVDRLARPVRWGTVLQC